MCWSACGRSEGERGVAAAGHGGAGSVTVEAEDGEGDEATRHIAVQPMAVASMHHNISEMPAPGQ